MKKLVIVLSMFGVFLLLNSCEKTIEEQERAYLEVSIEELNVSKDIDWVVVLPGLGCKGCIQSAEAFMVENIQNERILFVLTKITSVKILQKKLDINLREYSNIFLDTKRSFDVPSDNVIYPCIIQLKDQEIVAHQFQSPENEGFKSLRAELRKTTEQYN